MSRFFDAMNKGVDGKIVCPLCQTNEEGQVLLNPMMGTQKDGIAQCLQVHRRCAEALAYLLIEAMQ